MKLDSTVLIGALFLLSGMAMLLTLPGYQRKVESGQVKRDPSRPSFKPMRFAAIGFLVLGMVLVLGGFLHPA